MELKINIKNLCKNLANADEGNDMECICDTDGCRYLYENVVKPCITGIPLRICDIDFSAFEEDDIVNLIDNKSEMIDNALCTVSRVVNAFCESKALVVSKNKYF